MKKLTFALILIASLASAEDSRRIAFQTALPAQKAPQIDGILDEACWKQANWNDRYYEYVKANPKRVSPGTKNAIVWDQEGLYIGVVNPEPNPEKMKRTVTRNHHGSTWCDDSAELYIDPDAKGIGYYKFSVNSRGYYDDQWQMDRANIFAGWNGEGVKAAAQLDVSNKVWTIEFFVPWRDLGRASAMTPGELIMFNHNRFRYAGKTWAEFCSSAPEADYRRPENFGYVLISSGELPKFKDIATRIAQRLKQAWFLEIDQDLAFNDEDGLHFTSAAEFEAKQKALAERMAKAAALLPTILTNTALERCEIPARKELQPPANYDGHNGYYLHHLQRTFMTEHLDWGRNLESATKVIFGTHFYGSRMRYVAELFERIDFDGDVFTTFWGNNLGGHGPYEDPVSGATPNEAEARFGNLLRANPKVIAFWNFRYGNLRSDFRYEIARRIKDEGIGLLLIESDLAPEFSKCKRLTNEEEDITRLAPFAQNKVRVYACGKGRVITLSYLPSAAWSLEWRANMEARCVYLGRIVQAAAQALTSELAPIGVTNHEVVVASKLPRETIVEWRIRNARNTILASGTRPTEAKLSFPIDKLPGDTYTLDLIAKINGKTREFGYIPFSIESKVGPLTIDAPHFVENRAPFTATFSWQKPIQEKLNLTVTFRDQPYRHLRAKKTLTLSEGTTNAVLPFANDPISTRAGLLEATLSNQKGAPLCSAWKVVFLPDENWPIYPQINWEGLDANGLLEIHAPTMIEKYGWNCNIGEKSAGSALFNAWGQPVIALLRMGAGKDGAVRNTLTGNLFGWDGSRMNAALKEVEYDENPFRPEVRAIVERECKAFVEKSRAYGHLCYNLGDECGYSGEAGYGKSDKTIFPQFLERKYGSIANYNAIRGTNYTSFAQIPHKKLTEAREADDTQSWFDQVQYAEAIYAEAMKIHRDAIVKYEPRARVGAEGSAGGDLELTVKNLKYWGPYYSRVHGELLRVIMSPESVRGMWWGGYVNEPRDGLIRLQWEFLLTGAANCNLWYTCEIGSTMGIENGAFEPAPYFIKELPHMEKLRWGRGAQLVLTPLHRQGLALWYSHESNHAGEIDEKCVQPSETQNALLELCYRHGLGIELITKNRLEALKDQKVVVVAGGHALTDAEIAALRAFAQNGGHIIYDVTPCTFTSWMTRRKAGDNPLAGTGVILGESMADTWRKLKDPVAFDSRFLALLAQNDVAPRFMLEGAAKAPRTILRLRDGDGFTHVGILFPIEADGGNFTLRCADGKPRYIYKVDGGFVGRTNKLTLDPADYPWYEFTIFDQEATAPQLSLTQKDSTITLDPSPLRNNGVYRMEISGPRNHREVICVKGKQKPWIFHFALDDQPGIYTFKLIDLATGLASKDTITLNNTSTPPPFR